jgi:site-specific DNA-methyltransferase (cytosine-N4-specific)
MLLPKHTSAYVTNRGAAHCGDSLELLAALPDESVNLVLTSPPFALQREKEYGNKTQTDYVAWLAQFARLVQRKLKHDGSFVLDLGGSYEQGSPTRSLYNFRVAIHFCDDLGFFLAEDFYWYNPAKLPSPIEWVNKRKLRVKDAVNTVWWFGKSRWPKADVSKVLTEYSDRMKKLLKDPAGFYTPKKRPSGHDIGAAFSKDNGGAIPPNLLQISNSESNGCYLRGCKTVGAKQHPARFPAKLPEFFIRFLTAPGDLVVDIFAGSNTTGYVAEREGRRWLAFDERLDYLAASAFRFLPETTSDADMKAAHNAILAGQTLNLHTKVFGDAPRARAEENLYQPAAPAQGLLMLAESPDSPAVTKPPKARATVYRQPSKRKSRATG